LEYIIEPKIDGLSCAIEYKDGVFLGHPPEGRKKGEDVTPNVKTIKSLPLRLQGKKFLNILKLEGKFL